MDGDGSDMTNESQGPSSAGSDTRTVKPRSLAQFSSSPTAGCDLSRSVLVCRAVPGSVEAPDPPPLPPPPAPAPRCRLSTLLTAHHSNRKPKPPQISMLRTRTLPRAFLGNSHVPTRAPAR